MVSLSNDFQQRVENAARNLKAAHESVFFAETRASVLQLFTLVTRNFAETLDEVPDGLTALLSAAMSQHIDESASRGVLPDGEWVCQCLCLLLRASHAVKDRTEADALLDVARSSSQACVANSEAVPLYRCLEARLAAVRDKFATGLWRPPWRRILPELAEPALGRRVGDGTEGPPPY